MRRNEIRLSMGCRQFISFVTKQCFKYLNRLELLYFMEINNYCPILWALCALCFAEKTFTRHLTVTSIFIFFHHTNLSCAECWKKETMCKNSSPIFIRCYLMLHIYIFLFLFFTFSFADDFSKPKS